MDELGVVSSWSVIELSPYISDKVGISDLNLNIGGRFKLLENFSENLMFLPEVFSNPDGFADIAQSLALEFDPVDTNVFYFSTSEGLFRCNRRISTVPTRLRTEDLGAPTAISMSDSNYLLVGFSCGSIA
jgi:glucose-6-phosphate 1-dehydrogenase